jgi:hypothetical protein
MACVVLHDEEQGMSLVSFSQAVRVPTHYVDEARAATSAGYARKDTGLEVRAWIVAMATRCELAVELVF